MDSQFSELNETINELGRLISKKKRLRRAELISGLGKANITLRNILNDKNYFKNVTTFLKTDRTDATELQKALKNIYLFNKKFIAFENKALRKYGVDQGTKEIIIKRVRGIRKEAKASFVNQEDLISQVEKAIDDVTGLLKKLESEDKDLKFKREGEKNIRHVFYFLSGLTLVGINSMFAPEITTTNLSLCLGSGMVGKSL